MNDERDLPRMRTLATGINKEVGHVDAIRVVILAETEAGGRGQPRDVLGAGTALDLVGASDELRLGHVHRDPDILALG